MTVHYQLSIVLWIMKKILFITTGGTISCVSTKAGLAPELGAEMLLKAVNCDEMGISAAYEEPFLIDSTDMTPKRWLAIAKLIQSRYDEFDGFVITHGTDTMAYAAALLSVLIQNSLKPIAITGSMKPMSDTGSDAVRNLRAAFMYASGTRGFGVKVLFGGRIIDGTCAVKVNSVSEDAFRSVNLVDKGKYGDDSISYSYPGSKLEKRMLRGLEFYDRIYEGVYVARVTPGLRLRIPRFERLRAVIIETFGTGGIPAYCEPDIYDLCANGIYVIIATQALEGGTRLGKYRVGRRLKPDLPLLETGDYTVEYATARAQWALAYSQDFSGFRRLFEPSADR